MSLRRLPAASFALMMIGAVAGAQTLPADARVRIWATNPALTSHETRIIGSRGETLFFRDGPRTTRIDVSRSALTRLDMRVRKPDSMRRRVVRSTAIGAGVGAVTALAGAGLYSAAADASGNCGYENSCYLSILVAPPAGLILGGVTGALVGRARSFAWVSVPDPRSVQVAVPVPGRR